MKHVFLHDTNQVVNVCNIFCIGRNYAAHNTELGASHPSTPLVFLKPTSALCTEEDVICLPDFSSDIDYETELVLLIGREGKNVTPEHALTYIAGYGVGLDLTARDIQAVAKSQGLPWTIAKGFDYAACVSQFVLADTIGDPKKLTFDMKQNGVMRQQGHVSLMLFDIPHIISYLSSQFTLQAGDLVFTGTPEGIGRVHKGDRFELTLNKTLRAYFSVAP